MLHYFATCVRIFLKGFLSAKYFLVNLCIYVLCFAGILLFLQHQEIFAYGIAGVVVVLFLSTIYYDWRINDIWRQYYFLFHTINSAPFVTAILDENMNIIEYNELYQILCENKKIKNFDQFLEHISDYAVLVKALKEGMARLDTENNFSKDINFGDKIWRISLLSQFSKIGKIKIMFITDITSDLKINSIDKVLSNMLNYVEEGVVVTNRAGNIVFYNMAASNILKTTLIGKNIQNIMYLQNAQPNITQTVKTERYNLKITVNYYGEDYVLYRMNILSNQLDDIFAEAPFGVLVISQDLTIVSFNKFWNKYFKSTFKLEQCVAPNTKEAFIEYVKHFITTKNISPASFSLIQENGPLVTVFIQISRTDNINIFFIEDINARDLKAQFLHEQRLYSLGEIVGSISHDFNNVITTILGNCDVILERNSFLPTNEDYIDLMRIKHSASKAANLIRQILNISRKQTLKEETLEIGDLLSEFSATIGRVLGDNFDLKIVKKKTNINVFMNEVSFEQILINLTLNARDAMPYGGLIQITIDTTTLDKNIFENGHFCTKGDYMEMCITDTGIGISQDNIKKIFDPFFTTKKEKGTGFGLSTVNSIVKQKGGFIKVSSKMGVGTTFSVYLPIYLKNQTTKSVTYENLTTNIDILFVEDELNILLPTTKGLKSKGFNVTGLSESQEALKKGKEMKNLTILVTDVTMPKLNGVDLFTELRKKHPDLKVIFTSGYSEDKISHFTDNRVFFLQKPYSFKDLCDFINKAIASQ